MAKGRGQAESGGDDAEVVARVKELLGSHGGHMKKHGISYDSAVSPLYSTPKEEYTVKDRLPEINKALQTVLKEYLDVIGVEGKQAADYLHDLTLKWSELKTLFGGREDTVFDGDSAGQIKDFLRNKLRGKLREMVFSKIGEIQDPDNLSGLVEDLVVESGDKTYTPKGARDYAVDHGKAQEVLGQVYNPLVTQYEQAAKHVTKKAPAKK